LARRLKYCVNGEWRESITATYMPVTDSSTGEVIAEAPCCTVEEVNAAVDAAAEAFPGWAGTPVTKRSRLMFDFRAKLEQHMEELTLLVSTELGKNLDEARGDIIKSIEVIELACAVPVTMQGDSLMNVSQGFDTVMYREPLGVFAGIVPFNFPAMIPFGWMIPICIATGNTFVLKASSQTPLTAIRILELFYECGFPPGVIDLVTCSRREASLLLEHPKVRGISYVGSSTVGRHVYVTAAAHGKRVQVQGAAKNHGLVLRDANLEMAARTVINSCFGCAGMRCMALPVIVVENAVAGEFVAMLVKFAKQRRIGCAYDPQTELGPLVSAEHRQSVIEWINRGVEEGADLLLDGRDTVVPGFEKGFFVGATILDRVTPEMSVGNEEIFGPVVCVKRVEDFDEGLAVMNASPYANGSCIFTESGMYAREFAKRSHAGMVGINVGIPVPISVFPFSGHKDSFTGDLHVMGMDGVRFYTEVKSVTSRWFGTAKAEGKLSTWEGTITRTK